MQSDLDSVQLWLQANLLSLNVGKSHAILIGSRQKLQDHDLCIFVGGVRLSRVPFLRYLGVYIDETLSWRQQTQKLNQRVQSRLHYLYHLCPLPDGLMGKLYHTFVLLVLDYCDVVWSPSSAIILGSLKDFIQSFVHCLQIPMALYVTP